MNARPVYTPPQTYRVVPDYMQPGSYASVQEVHHGRRGELHKDVLAATLHRPAGCSTTSAQSGPRTSPAREGPGPMESPTAGVADPPDASPGERSCRAGEPGTNQRQHNWQPNGKDIAATLPARCVVAALEHAEGRRHRHQRIHVPAVTCGTS